MRNDTPPLGPVSSGLDILCWLVTAVSSVMMVFLIAGFGYLVWGRYVMNDTPTWVEQMSLLLIVWITLLGAATGVRGDRHLSMAFFRDALPHAVRLPLSIVSHLAMMVLGCVMAWHGWTLTGSNLERIIPMLGIAEGWRNVPVAICGALIVLFSIEHLVTRLRSTKDDC